jgi:uncharacterized membrane protein
MSLPPSTTKPQRQTWIDALRGIAVLGMIWTHACNTFLADTLIHSALFDSLTYWHGLVAPTFLFLAGYNRGLALPYREGKPAWPTVRRLLMIWAIGYLMHVPWGSLTEWSEAAQCSLFQADVLHCLAASCLLLLGLEQLGAPKARIVAGILLAAVLALSWRGLHTGWLPLDAYLTRDYGSLFPLLPWLGFPLAGFLAPTLRPWAISALGLAFCLGLPMLSHGYVPQFFFLERLGWVLLEALLLRILWPFLSSASASKNQHIQNALLLCGRESLIMYVTHLLLIHSVPLWQGRTAQGLWSGSFGWPEVGCAFMLLTALSFLVAWAWDRRK